MGQWRIGPSTGYVLYFEWLAWGTGKVRQGLAKGLACGRWVACVGSNFLIICASSLADGDTEAMWALPIYVR